MKKQAFTLAEILIVLTVIGIITAILLPASRHLAPDENVLKFKKAHNALHAAIRELVNSDKYYMDGDLGIKPNGDMIDGTHTDDDKYMCKTLADVLKTKEIKCGESETNRSAWVDTWANSSARASLDELCANPTKDTAIVVSKNIIIYEVGPKTTYGMTLRQAHLSINHANPSENNITRGFGGYIKNGVDVAYKAFCVDIDGKNFGEEPFGYGIRADGKILNGARAEQWLKKPIQRKDD